MSGTRAFDEALARRMRYAMRARGVTLRALAAATGVPEATLGKNMRGETAPKASTVALVARELRLNAAALMRIPDEEGR
jgi:transcriptional regulator with XRE-family HTH domain